MAQKTYPILEEAIIASIANVLGETSDGLTGSEIEQLLAQSRITDIAPTLSKRHRLREALLVKQSQDRASNCVIRFLAEAMSPVRYSGKPNEWARRRDDLKEVLVHAGLRINDQGKVARGAKASTLSDAARLAGSVRTELLRRGTHPNVLKVCSEEIFARDWFHAGHEACKGVSDRLRTMSGSRLDGAELTDEVLALGSSGIPVIQVADISDKTGRSEQEGFKNLCKGISMLFRNRTAHELRISSDAKEAWLYEILGVASLIHHRLDSATMNTRTAHCESAQ